MNLFMFSRKFGVDGIEWFLKGILCCGRVSLKAIRSLLASLNKPTDSYMNGRLVVISGSNCCKIVVDGAWKASSCQGAAAWCGLPEYWRIKRVSRLFSAGTTSMAEGIAALQALRWAHSKGLKQVQILLDAVEMISGVKDVRNANVE